MSNISFKSKKKKRKIKEPQKAKKVYKFKFNRRKSFIRNFIIVVSLISAIFGSFLLVSYLGKDVNIHLYSDLDLDEYEEIFLITEREGYEYKLPLDLDEGESYFRIPKTSKIKEFEVRKDILISEDYSKEIYSSYSHDETLQINQSFSNIDFKEGIPYNNFENNSLRETEHYDGVNCFFYDEINLEPMNFEVDYGIARVVEEYEGHRKALELEGKTKGWQEFDSLNNGTMEFWTLIKPYQDLRLTLYNHNDILIKIKTICSPNYLYYHNGFFYSDNGKLADNRVFSSEWVNIRIDFRCDGATEYLGLSEGKYEIYINDIKVYENKDLIQYGEEINKVVLESLGYSNKVYFDSVSFTSQKKEFNNETYKIGDKDKRLISIDKDFYRNFKFLDTNYKYLKNATIEFMFKTNISLIPDRETGLMVYNFLKKEWEFIESFSNNITLFLEVSDISYFNDTSLTETDIHFLIITSNLENKYSTFISMNCSAYFWKEISYFEYTETFRFEGELMINIITTTEFKETEIIITSEINISYYYCFGSWILQNSTIIINEIIIHEQIYRIDFDDEVNLSDDTFYGWRTVEIEIEKIDLYEREIDTSVEIGDMTV